MNPALDALAAYGKGYRSPFAELRFSTAPPARGNGLGNAQGRFRRVLPFSEARSPATARL